MHTKTKRVSALLLSLCLFLFASCGQASWTLWTVNSAVFTVGKFDGFYQWNMELPSEWILQEENENSKYFKTQLGEFTVLFSLGEVPWEKLDDAGILVYDMAEKISLVNGDVMYLRSGDQNTFLYQAEDDLIAEFIFTKTGTFSLSSAKEVINHLIGSMELVEKENSEAAYERYQSLPRFEEGKEIQ